MTTDPYARREQMFPRLTAAQIARVGGYGERRAVRRGEILFDQGDVSRHFYVVIAGAIEIVQISDGREHTVTVHHAGEFTGEIDLLAGRRCLVRGRVEADGEVVAVTREDLRKIVQTDAELSEVLMRAFILRRMGLIARGESDLVLLGSRHSAGTLRLQEFLTRNAQPYSYVDVERDPSVQVLLDRFQVRVEDVPVVICGGGHVLRNPSNEKIAGVLGLSASLDAERVHDVVVVGAGPAGLAAAVYAASEGLDTLVLEVDAPGGQAGTSSRIENYLGFPTGISGQALAGRALAQAGKFGADVALARRVTRLHCERTPYEVHLADGQTLRTRVVVIASGVGYRRLPLPELSRFENSGVYYAATHVEGQLCTDEDLVVVGGGNSAGQAAVYLSGAARTVHMLVRADGLSETMSRYLIRRIEESPNIKLHTRTEIVGLEGGESLERVRWRDARTGQTETQAIRHVFLMMGADPKTDWLEGCVALDSKGFVLTGSDLRPEALAEMRWPLARAPMLLETSQPRVFAVGDVRAGSVKRVAAAVGEGSTCVQLIHRALAEP